MTFVVRTPQTPHSTHLVALQTELDDAHNELDRRIRTGSIFPGIDAATQTGDVASARRRSLVTISTEIAHDMSRNPGLSVSGMAAQSDVPVGIPAPAGYNRRASIGNSLASGIALAQGISRRSSVGGGIGGLGTPLEGANSDASELEDVGRLKSAGHSMAGRLTRRGSVANSLASFSQRMSVGPDVLADFAAGDFQPDSAAPSSSGPSATWNLSQAPTAGSRPTRRGSTAGALSGLPMFSIGPDMAAEIAAADDALHDVQPGPPAPSALKSPRPSVMSPSLAGLPRRGSAMANMAATLSKMMVQQSMPVPLGDHEGRGSLPAAAASPLPLLSNASAGQGLTGRHSNVGDLFSQTLSQTAAGIEVGSSSKAALLATSLTPRGGSGVLSLTPRSTSGMLGDAQLMKGQRVSGSGSEPLRRQASGQTDSSRSAETMSRTSSGPPLARADTQGNMNGTSNLLEEAHSGTNDPGAPSSLPRVPSLLDQGRVEMSGVGLVKTSSQTKSPLSRSISRILDSITGATPSQPSAGSPSGSVRHAGMALLGQQVTVPHVSFPALTDRPAPTNDITARAMPSEADLPRQASAHQQHSLAAVLPKSPTQHDITSFLAPPGSLEIAVVDGSPLVGEDCDLATSAPRTPRTPRRKLANPQPGWLASSPEPRLYIAPASPEALPAQTGPWVLLEESDIATGPALQAQEPASHHSTRQLDTSKPRMRSEPQRDELSAHSPFDNLQIEGRPVSHSSPSVQ